MQQNKKKNNKKRKKSRFLNLKKKLKISILGHWVEPRLARRKPVTLTATEPSLLIPDICRSEVLATGLTRTAETLLQGNQEPLVVRDKVTRPTWGSSNFVLLEATGPPR